MLLSFIKGYHIHTETSVLINKQVNGGFHMVGLIITELKDHMTFYKFECSHWLKLQHSHWRANLVKDFL